ncbi:hypothetical protein EST38_g13510 [Candolleomyces aberdarensis]|uniref:Integrase catalytic domain-containing protein n=1 Tax=Candolleomyces aberdarensis TaxID=2316362 RepID=A0A4Q2D1L7_9AGAR|nr:hypothetical protein EST38_g13510 [Candolleomyces aberdarensis]
MEVSLDPEKDGSYSFVEFDSFKYKKVANRVKPVSAPLPPEFRIERRIPEDPLADLPSLPTHPPDFSPGERYTQERKETMNVNPNGFLSTEEEKLVHHLIKTCEDGFAWDESEKGIFSSDYLNPVRIPTLDHNVWIKSNIPIPRGLQPKIIKILKEKQAAGVIEPSNAAYRSQWFWVLKKDGKSLRIVHNLQPLNAVTIKDSAVPPTVEPYAESFAGRACYSVLDLFVGFDQRELHPDSRDLTTFQSPLGTFRLTRIPMGYTNSQQVQHGDLTFILQDEIPEVTMPFVDDVPVRGPATRYELPGGGFETIPENPGIRRFVWEHVQDVMRVIWRVKKAGGTFSGPKAQICVPEAVIVGHLCTYEGRRPLPDRVQKIIDWPIPRDLTGVRGFLGTVGTMRMFIKDYAVHSEPLVRLTRRAKAKEFIFGPEELEAMEKIKVLVTQCPAIRPIDYDSDGEVILAVDSSHIAVGYILSQNGNDGLRYPSRFGSITWNDRERRYSQAKIELFGLLRALKDVRIYIIAVKKLVVEVDARYIKGMINNPDIQPNATINRWIAGILLFDFELRHVPARHHGAADGLSRREQSPNDPVLDDDYDQWIDEANAFAIELTNWGHSPLRYSHEITPLVSPRLAPIATYVSFALESAPQLESAPLTTLESAPLASTVSPAVSVLQNSPTTREYASVPRSEKAIAKDQRLRDVGNYLSTLSRPVGLTGEGFAKFLRFALNFFVLDGRLFRKERNGRHQLVIPQSRRLSLIQQAHDELGHKGVFTVSTRLLTRFWWPHLLEDVKWWVRTCHECQVRNTARIHIPPTVASPFSLFRKFYIDTMFLPPSHGFTCIVHARCSLSSYPEWRMLRVENARSLGSFIFEDILCRYGMVEEIVCDNGPPYTAALDYLKERYGICNIRISPYNSQANGPVERRHYDVREAIMKAAQGSEKDWPLVAASVFWAERVTIQKSTGYSPYYIAHGIEPIFPFDLAEATLIAPRVTSTMSTGDLIAYRAIQLQRRQEDLDKVKASLHKARIASARQYEERFRATIKDFNFSPGSLVLVRNSRFDSSVGSKAKPRYHGPLIVVRRTTGGSYILSELDGSISRLRYAAYRLLPYHPRDIRQIPVSSITDKSNNELDNLTRDREPNIDL